MRNLLADREQLTHYLRCPREHRSRVRHSNFIERTFGETRRRVKVIGRLPGETSCLTLVWAVLDRGSRGWPRVHHDPRQGCASSRTYAARCSAHPHSRDRPPSEPEIVGVAA